MNNKTAVEILIDELRNHIAEGTLDAIAITRLRRQAKDLEKCQIIGAYQSDRIPCSYEDGEQYYNETYK